MFLFCRELVGATVLGAWLALLAPSTVLVAASSSYSPSQAVHKIVLGVDGGTESIRACCFDAQGKVIG